MSTWETVLQPFKLGDIELPTTQRTMSGGRDIMRGAPPNRPGQYTSDMGRKAFTFSLTIPLYDGMQSEGVTYPDDYEDLLFLLTDDLYGGAYEYIDGVLGAFNVRITEWSLDDSAQERDGGIFKITMEENSTDESTYRFTLNDSATSAGTAGNMAANADQDLAVNGVDDAAMDAAFFTAGAPRTGEELFWPAGSFVESSTADAFAAIQSASFATADVANNVDRFTARVDALLELDALKEPETWRIRVPLIVLSDSVKQALAKVSAQGPRIVIVTTDGAVDVYSFAVQQGVSVHDVLALNDIPRPLSIPSRTALRVPR